MTPYKSMSKEVCDNIGPQVSLVQGYSHPLHGAVCYDFHHLFAPVCHDALSRNAWHLERSSPAYPVLAGVYASPLPGTENLGRAGVWLSGISGAITYAMVSSLRDSYATHGSPQGYGDP